MHLPFSRRPEQSTREALMGLFFLNLHQHLYCTSATSPVIMATLLVHAAARGWSGTGTNQVLQKPLLLAYHCRRVRSKCLRAQVLKSHFWHSSATTSNRQLATAPTHALLHHRLLPPFLSGLLQAKNSSQEQQLRLMKTTSLGMYVCCMHNAFQLT